MINLNLTRIPYIVNHFNWRVYNLFKYMYVLIGLVVTIAFSKKAALTGRLFKPLIVFTLIHALIPQALLW